MRAAIESPWLAEPAELAAQLPAGFTIGVSMASGAVSDDDQRELDDVGLIRDLGADACRFSLSWPRLQPGGKGQLGRYPLAFYDRLLDELLASGISPVAALYHGDTPEALADGWLDHDTAYRFADYAELAGDAFGDRIQSWITVADPASVMLDGYAREEYVPGATLLMGALPAAHHLLLGHGLAVQALRAVSVSGRIGIANLHSPAEPATDRDEDDASASLFDMVHNRIFADPVLLGRYPDVPAGFATELRFLEEIDSDDVDTIHQPLDFYGLSYFFPSRIAAGSSDAPTQGTPAKSSLSLPLHLAGWPEFAATESGWPTAPEYLAQALGEVRARYGDAVPPVYVTGGASFPDSLEMDGTIPDAPRISYLADHLAAATSAVATGHMAAGLDLRGYVVRSLADDVDRRTGVTQHFGLVHVDFENQTHTRTPKASYRWLQRLLENR